MRIKKKIIMENEKKNILKILPLVPLETIKDKKFLRRVWKVKNWLKNEYEKSDSHPFHFLLGKLKKDTNLSQSEIRQILEILQHKERVIEIDSVRLNKPELYKNLSEKVLPRPKTSWEPLTAGASFFFSKKYIFNNSDEVSCGIYESPFEKYSQVLAKILRKKPLQFEPSLASKIKRLKRNDWIVCGKLKFNPESGDFIYGKVEDNFPPETQEFKVLLKLLTSNHHQAEYDTLLGEMYPDRKEEKFKKIYRMELNRVIKNIKYKLRILPKAEAKNKDIFKVLKKWEGYRLVCK